MLTKGGWGNLRTLAIRTTHIIKIEGNNLGFNGNLAIASMNTKSKKSDIR